MATAHDRRKRKRRLLASLAMTASLALGSCAGSVDTEKPVGVGSTPNTLKSSPCACVEVPNLARG